MTTYMKTKLRHVRELEWIKRLQTPFPLGLNDNIFQQGNISRNPEFDIFGLFEDKKRNSRSHGIRKNGNVKRKSKQCITIQYLNYTFNTEGRHKFYIRLCSLSIKKLIFII